MPPFFLARILLLGLTAGLLLAAVLARNAIHALMCLACFAIQVVAFWLDGRK